MPKVEQNGLDPKVDEQETVPVRRRSRLRRWRVPLAVLLVLFVAGLLTLWSMRVRLATSYVDEELARRGVSAAYEVKRIGFGTQVLENLVIGDPDRPDATARRVEVQILFGITGPRVGLIRARGVRMYGRVEDGQVRLGQVDRLLPPPSGLPFRLPDQRVDVADAAIALETPAGPLALGLAGRGNLADGFRGRIALVSRGLRLGDCAIEQPRANVAVTVADLRPRLAGPAAVRAMRCGDGLAVDRLRLALDARLDPGLDAWRGHTAIRADRFEARPQRLDEIEGRLTFSGDAARTVGSLDIGSAAAAVDSLRAERTRIAGRYALSPDRGDFSLNGEVTAGGLAVAPSALAGPVGSLRATDGTPLGPIGAALAQAVDRAGRGGGDGSARVRLANGPGFGALRLDRLEYAARSGARLDVGGGDGITYYWPSGRLRLDGDFALAGGGFPETRFQLRQASATAPLEGVGRIAPITADGARLALGEIRFAGTQAGVTRFRTALQLDGPVGDGRVTGLTLPVEGRFGPNGLAVGEGCVDAAFRELRVSGLRVGPTRLPLCPVGPALIWRSARGPVRFAGELRAPRLAGRLGQSPVTLASDRIRIDLDGFRAVNLAARLGPPDNANRLDVQDLGGRFGGGGISGNYGGLSGKIANVPLLVSEAAGAWRLDGGRLELDGRLQIADEQEPSRFHPLVGEDFSLALAGNAIRAGGWLAHPQSGTRVAQATIEHDLGTGAGLALLDVPGLTFSPGFQPEALTSLTTGIVALVDGTVIGQGRIEWDEAEVRSTGTFSTAGMDLAAPFGPIEGLSTTVNFTDLLGLVSAPGQVARADVVRAGIDVYDGSATYQLLPDYHVAVESGHWPFAGGDLFLQPTMLDFSRPSTKYLTFRVVGLDAATFVQQMEFGNIAATGTFDGLIPMQFDIRGGRIVGGRLEARPAGGTLSYVGELTDRDLGTYGILAFNALKALRYSRFDLTLEGALDGEFITIIDLDGIARDPALTTVPSGGGIPQLVAGRVFNQLARIPFKFNIRIEGQFRALIATARSFSDPTPLIQSVLPEVLRDQSTIITDVQDEESEPVQ